MTSFRSNSGQSRRTFLSAISGLAVAAMPALSQTLAIAQTPTPAVAKRRPAVLQSPQGIEVLATRSRMVLELSGKLKVADPDPSSKKPPREAEIKAESTVDFDERILFDSDNSVQAAARRYNEADVKSWIAGHSSSHRLRPECGETRLLLSDGVWQQYCPTQPMQPREIDMTRLPINTVVIEQLLPATPVKPNSSWSPTDQTVAQLFHLEAVHSSTVKASVTKVESGVATIEFDGAVEGSVNNVPTKLNVQGNLQTILGTQSAFVKWLGMSLTETREISQAEPGFTLTARIKLIRKEEPDACNDVPHSELKALAESDDQGRWMLQIASVPGRYQFLADRRWKLIVDTGEEAILRLVEKNQVVAQCNITRLPKLAAGQQLSLAGMQDDIKRSLDKNLQQIQEAGERKNKSGMRVLRVVAMGSSSDVPVRWVYAHASDDSGRRNSLVFTMSSEATESFALADEQIIGSFQLLPEVSKGEPTEAASKPTATKTR